MYRRLNGTEVWHSNAGCVAWPLLNFEEKGPAASGKVCAECIELEQMVASRPVNSSIRDSAEILQQQ